MATAWGDRPVNLTKRARIAMIVGTIAIPLEIPMIGAWIGYEITGDSKGAAVGAVASLVGIALLVGSLWIGLGMMSARQEWAERHRS